MVIDEVRQFCKVCENPRCMEWEKVETAVLAPTLLPLVCLGRTALLPTRSGVISRLKPL
eukprot:COSAG02_NODE_11478_length_1716_cov_90.455164_1_plen_58_part_10